MSVINKELVITMPDESQWAVPVHIIAVHRANWYAREFDGDAGRSLHEDTLPLFEEDEYEIRGWAANNMNWADVKGHARVVSEPSVDYQDGWVNGEYEVLEKT